MSEFDALHDADEQLFRAGYAHVDSMVPRADQYSGHAPAWFGWALREAFWKGALWQKQRNAPEATTEQE